MFERCELAQELYYNQDFPRGDLGDWVCLTYYESAWNTAATNHNTDGSTDYGIYEINNNFWCDSDFGASNDCSIDCQNLIDSNISDDSDCAMIIFRRHGFDAWYGWKNNCKGQDNEDWVADCGV